MEKIKRKPVFGDRPFGKRDARLLLIAYFDPNGIETIQQGIAAFQAMSRHEILLMNLWPGREGRMCLPESLDIREFDGLIIHPTVSYSPATVLSLDDRLRVPLASFDGVKILMKQDEQVDAGMLAELVRDKGFDIVCTCVPLAEQKKVYPRAVIGEDCTLLQTYTGYVSPDMRRRPRAGRRDLGLTYRGSIQPLAFGRLGYEKRGIGYDVAAALERFPDVDFDISSHWEDRLSGVAWQDFLEHSAVVLGVESGANIFDFDGTVAEWCKAYDERHRGDDVTTYAYYKRADEEFLHTVEGNVNYAQISPRHFEAAAAGAAQLLYEGEYSGLFKPYRHFFPLKRDLSNLDAVVDFLRDQPAQRQMAECAFDEIILDRNNWYESFVAAADSAIDTKLVAKGRRRCVSRLPSKVPRPLAYVLCAHDPVVDPRIGWFAATLSKTHDVTVIGVNPRNNGREGPSLEEVPGGIKVLRVERTRHDAGWLPIASELCDGTTCEARALLATLVGYGAAPDALLRRRLGAEIAVAGELERFRTLCTYLVNTNSALIGAVEKLGPPNLVVAADLEALYAAVACGETTDASVVFDAHEYWPWSYTDFQHWEIEFWSAMEGRLAGLADLNIAVTPQLAGHMGNEYGVTFHCLPNAATLSEGDLDALEGAFARRLTSKEPLRVLYLGGFAHGRGLEEVIHAWTYLRSDAQLILRGPDNEYRQAMIRLARSLGLGESEVSFPDAVSESDLISTALEADLGLLPYNPIWFGYRYCCPNKLSQYSAAGLPILSSETEFVAGIVKQNAIGYIVDITDPQQIATHVDGLAGKRHELVEMGRRARAFFEKSFNWETLSAPVMEEIAALQKDVSPRRADFGWIRSSHRAAARGAAITPPAALFGGNAEEQGSNNAALFERGTTIVGASAFHDFPHHPAYLLREPKPGGYAAALAGTNLPHWIELDFGVSRVVEEVAIDWFDAQNFAKRYSILVKSITKAEWHPLVEVENASSAVARHRFSPISFRYLRLVTSEFVGQPRMLIRSLRALQPEVMPNAVPAVGVEIAPPVGMEMVTSFLASARQNLRRLSRKAKNHYLRSSGGRLGER